MGFKDWFSKPKFEVTPGAPQKSFWGSWNKWALLEREADEFDFIDREIDGIVDPAADKMANRRVCEDALKSISRSANVILNSTNDLERIMKVKFSDGTNQNTIEETTIYLSPDKLVSCKTRDDRDEIIDSMSGQAMLCSQLKRQIDAGTYDKFVKSTDKDVRSLWSAIETAIARGDVIADWSGFKPYFDTYARYSSKVNSTVIKRELSKYNGSSPLKPTNASALVMGLAWNLYHSHDPVKIPAPYNAGKMLIANELKDADTCEKRWDMCVAIVSKLREMYDISSSPPPKGPGPGAPKEKFDQESEEEISAGELLAELEVIRKLETTPPEEIKPPKKKGVEKFTGVDEELFGTEAVVNKKCKVASDIESIAGDSVTDISDTIGAPMVPISGKNKRDIEKGSQFWVPKDEPSKETKRHFDINKLSELNKLAEIIKDSFGFTDKVNKRKIFGLSSGTIRPESLYKLELGSDEVFYRKTEKDVDKVSVCLLIDQSGSMGCSGAHSEAPRIIEAAEVAYVLAKLVKDIKHMDLSVVGFSAQEGCTEARDKLDSSSYDSEVNMRLIYDSLELENSKLEDICHMRAHANNLDGFSIWYAAKRMAESRAGRKRKVLIVVSDGSPNGRGYGGESAAKHVLACKQDAKFRFGVDTYAIGISNAYDQSDGDEMYGPGSSIVISDVKSSIGYLSRFLNQVSQLSS